MGGSVTKFANAPVFDTAFNYIIIIISIILIVSGAINIALINQKGQDVANTAVPGALIWSGLSVGLGGTMLLGLLLWFIFLKASPEGKTGSQFIQVVQTANKVANKSD